MSSSPETSPYDSLNTGVLDVFPSHSKKVLDLGCGVGRLGLHLREQYQAIITGVTIDKNEAEIARQHLQRVIVADLEKLDVHQFEDLFDCVICCHSLEHLRGSDSLLTQLHSIMHDQSVLIVALPNVLFWKQRLAFLLGHFRYTNGGLMDTTHVRFYDWQTAQELLVSNGFDIEIKFASGSLPGARFLGQTLAKRINHIGLKWFPGLLGWQFVFRCKKK